MIVSAAQFKAKFSNPPRFIVLDGVNGAGKTTLQRRILEFLSSKGVDALSTREPGGSALGKHIRPILLERAAGEIAEVAELFLFSADRAEHVRSVIRPAVNANRVVICDRYFYSTLAFQGYGRGFSLKQIEEVSAIAVDGMYPDLVLLLDLDPLTGLKRNQIEAKLGTDAFENEDLDFHKRLHAGFLKVAETRPEPFIVLDANQTPDSLFASAREILLHYWP